MTKEEKKALSAIVNRLIAVQSDAPTKTTYVRGRSDRSMSYELRDIIMELKAIADYVEPDTTEERAEASEAST